MWSGVESPGTHTRRTRTGPAATAPHSRTRPPVQLLRQLYSDKIPLSFLPHRSPVLQRHRGSCAACRQLGGAGQLTHQTPQLARPTTPHCHMVRLIEGRNTVGPRAKTLDPEPSTSAPYPRPLFRSREASNQVLS